MKLSPRACAELIETEDLDLEGATDCPEGCVVEPDGWCPHEYLSAMETLLRMQA